MSILKRVAGAERRSSVLPRSMNWWLTLGLALMLVVPVGFRATPVQAQASQDSRPNVVLIVADDGGFSDWGSFGGEAYTPNIDSLATSGMRLSNFRVLPTCSPTRSVLLTGVTNHMNGLGTMQGQLSRDSMAAQFAGDQPGYAGYFHSGVVNIATLLQDAGYNTYHVGKWHLAQSIRTPEGQPTWARGTWPIDMGFDRSYGMLEGGGDHWGYSGDRPEGGRTHWFENDKLITLPPDYYSAKNHTDKALEFIAADRAATPGQRTPFFLYYATTMPHYPNQVPDEFIKQEYIDFYLEQGWIGTRNIKLDRLKALGLVPATVTLPDTEGILPDWNNENDPLWAELMKEVTNPVSAPLWKISTVAEYKLVLAKKMASYTAMIDYMDYSVGRIINQLKASGEYDNTMFIVMSDNGADGISWDFNNRNYMAKRKIDNSFANIGRPNSYVSLNAFWSQVAGTPFDGYKATVLEGGIRSPLIITYPKANIKAGSISSSMTVVSDIPATILDYIGLRHPVGTGVAPNWASCTGTYKNRTGVCPMSGKSLRDLLEGNAKYVHLNEPIAFELFGRVNKALLLEEEGALWKIVRTTEEGYPIENWLLFNLAVDQEREASVLNSQYPDKLRQMIELYNQYEYNVRFVPSAQFATTMKTARPGDVVSHSFLFRSNSPGNDSFNFVCRSAWPCTITQQGSVALAPGGTVRVQANISVPTGVAARAINTAQINVLANTYPEASRNFTAITTCSGCQVPQPVNVTTEEGYLSVVLVPQPNTASLTDGVDTYRMEVRGYGDLDLREVVINIPFTPGYRVANVRLDQRDAWVSRIGDASIDVRLARVDGANDGVIGTLTFRSPGATGTNALIARATVNWPNKLRRIPGFSNLPLNSSRTPLTTRVTLADGDQAYNFNAATFAPNEPVSLWFTSAAGVSTALVAEGSVAIPAQAGTADASRSMMADRYGSLSAQINTSTLAPGTYTVAARGGWSGVVTSAPFTVVR
jgi:arylsulfatase